MSFNKSFDLVAYINDMPLSIRKHVLLSLVGTVNAGIVSAADRVAQVVIADGQSLNDLRAIDPREISQLMDTVDFQGDVSGDKIRKLVALGNVLRPMLLQADGRGNTELGALAGTIEMMVGHQRLRPVNPNAAKLLKTVDIEVTPEQIEQTREARRDADQLRANDRAKRRGFIEWAVNNCFTSLDDSEDDPDAFGDLDEGTKEQLCNKVSASLNKGITTATVNVLTGAMNPDALGLGDIPMLRNLLAEMLSAIYPPSVQVKPVQADAPSSKARRVKKTADETDQKLVNALHKLATSA
jgi:hypothetical protein